MFNPMDLSGRRYVITGASSGIGQDVAVLLSQLGAVCLLTGRDLTRLNETLERMVPADHQVQTLELGGGDLCGWFKERAREFGPLDGLIHSAGVHSIRPLRILGTEELDQLFRVNVYSAVQAVRGFRQKGVRKESSSVVLLSSVAGIIGWAGGAAYGGTKAALMSIARSLAQELAPERIRVNCVAPGVVETRMAERAREMVSEEAHATIVSRHPLGLGQPRDVANAVAFLLADTARWITGTTLVVDGGFTAR